MSILVGNVCSWACSKGGWHCVGEIGCSRRVGLHSATLKDVDADPSTLKYHIDTLIRFRDGLGEVPAVKKVSPTTVVTKNGLTISVY